MAMLREWLLRLWGALRLKLPAPKLSRTTG